MVNVTPLVVTINVKMNYFELPWHKLTLSLTILTGVVSTVGVLVVAQQYHWS